MNTRITLGLALSGAVILAACGQDRNSPLSLPTEASLAKATAPTCSFSTASQDARAYFTDTRTDPVFALLDAMQSAYRTGGPSGATNEGFAVLARLGAAVEEGATAVKGTPAQGSTFANDVLRCMSVTGYTSAVDFANALGATGVFAVRDNTNGAAVVSRGADGNGPFYGLEPTGLTWPLAGKTLFYGWRLTVTTLAGETVSGKVFDLRTLPSGLTFSPAARAGVCVLDDADARILHKHVNDVTVLAPAGMPTFCTTSQINLTPASSPFEYAARAVRSWLTPAPAYAMRPFGGGGGGLVSGLSEIGPVEFTDSLAFQGRVPNATLSDTAKSVDADTTTNQFRSMITVRAVTRAGKNPLEGVTLKLTVIGNQGSYQAVNDEAVTDADGYAVFRNFYINKPGGYTISATAPEFTSSSTATSNQFNISGQ